MKTFYDFSPFPRKAFFFHLQSVIKHMKIPIFRQAINLISNYGESSCEAPSLTAQTLGLHGITREKSEIIYGG